MAQRRGKKTHPMASAELERSLAETQLRLDTALMQNKSLETDLEDKIIHSNLEFDRLTQEVSFLKKKIAALNLDLMNRHYDKSLVEAIKIELQIRDCDSELPATILSMIRSLKLQADGNFQSSSTTGSTGSQIIHSISSPVSTQTANNKLFHAETQTFGPIAISVGIQTLATDNSDTKKAHQQIASMIQEQSRLNGQKQSLASEVNKVKGQNIQLRREIVFKSSQCHSLSEQLSFLKDRMAQTNIFKQQLEKCKPAEPQNPNCQPYQSIRQLINHVQLPQPQMSKNSNQSSKQHIASSQGSLRRSYPDNTPYTSFGGFQPSHHRSNTYHSVGTNQIEIQQESIQSKLTNINQKLSSATSCSSLSTLKPIITPQPFQSAHERAQPAPQLNQGPLYRTASHSHLYEATNDAYHPSIEKKLIQLKQLRKESYYCRQQSENNRKLSHVKERAVERQRSYDSFRAPRTRSASMRDIVADRCKGAIKI